MPSPKRAQLRPFLPADWQLPERPLTSLAFYLPTYLTTFLLLGLLASQGYAQNLSQTAVAPSPVAPAVALEASTEAQNTSASSSASGSWLSVTLPAYPEAHAWFLSGEVGAAIKALQAQQAGHENDADFYNLLGVLLLTEKSYAAAADAFEHAVLIAS